MYPYGGCIHMFNGGFQVGCEVYGDRVWSPSREIEKLWTLPLLCSQVNNDFVPLFVSLSIHTDCDFRPLRMRICQQIVFKYSCCRRNRSFHLFGALTAHWVRPSRSSAGSHQNALFVLFCFLPTIVFEGELVFFTNAIFTPSSNLYSLHL